MRLLLAFLLCLPLASAAAQSCHSLPSFATQHGKVTVSAGSGIAYAIQASAGKANGLYVTESVVRFTGRDGKRDWYTGLDEYLGWQIGDRVSLCPYLYAAYYEASGDEFTKGFGMALGWTFGHTTKIVPSIGFNWRGTSFAMMEPNRHPEETLVALGLVRSHYGLRVSASHARDTSPSNTFRIGLSF